jgi:GTPase
VKRLKEVAEQSFAGRKAVLIGFREREERDTEESIKELEFLCKTLKLKVIKSFIYKPTVIHPATYIGKGRVQEIKDYSDGEKPSFVIFGRELTPIQQRNLEEILGVRVIDRTELILHIFGEHAKSKEGKIQVELARLSYLLPRLTGHGISLSRVGGGLETKGPGEMKIEVYRRRIKDRIHRLNEEMKDVEKHREVIRNSRRRKNFPLVTLLGYTNVGKSSLLNRLSASELYVENKLFSTLDPATRAVYIGENRTCLVSDTVGLLYNIPHHMIEAFKSTLEEVRFSDLILCLYDSSAFSMERQINTMSEVFKILEVEEKPHIDIFNKIDLLSPEELSIIKSDNPNGLFASALTGEGIDRLKESIRRILYGDATVSR